MTVACEYCGAENHESAQFCSACGKPVLRTIAIGLAADRTEKLTTLPATLPKTAATTRTAVPPTTRLVLALAQLSTGQLLALLAAGLLAVVILVALLTPLQMRYRLLWDNFDGLAIVAPLAFALARRRGAAFVAFVSVAIVGRLTVWLNVGSANANPVLLPLAALLVGLLIEGAFAPLPRWVPLSRREKWKTEVLWLMATSAFSTPLFHALLFGPEWFFYPGLWATSALFGAAGWFVGDAVREYFALRKAGSRVKDRA